jgi:DNA polymerase III subunit alpha
MTQPFIHLHVRSAYSLGEGAIPVKALVAACVRQGMPAVAVTDVGTMFGALDFATTAAAAGVQPILGAQVATDAGGPVVLLVQDEAGYRNLSHLISAGYTRTGGQGDFVVPLADLAARAGGLICLTGGAAGPVAQDILKRRGGGALDALRAAFGDRLYMQIERHGLPAEAACEDALLEAAYARDIPLVATNGAYFPDRAAHDAHDALLCISGGRYITEDDRRRETAEHYLKTPAEMAALFADLPEAVANTVVIAQRCHFLLRPIDPILPAFAPGQDEAAVLRQEAQAGLRWRLENFVLCHPERSPAQRGAAEGPLDSAKLDSDTGPSTPGGLHRPALGMTGEDRAKPYWDRLNHELAIIADMGFPGYFLIVSDFIRWAKDQGIPVGPGRGSGAGSVVAWALKITDLDPIALGLVFERFLNPERVSMPDFDIDFCQERRDEVIAYVQQRYGADRVAQIITFGTLQARAVVRDVGRVLQMPYGQVDRLAKMIPSNPADPIPLAAALEADAELRAARDRDDTNKKLIEIALQLEGLYRHASTHAAGVVIGDRPLPDLVPLYQDPRAPLPATMFNMKWVEKAGLVKFDFLGLKTMTTIQKAVDMVNAYAGDPPPPPLSARGGNDGANLPPLEQGGVRGGSRIELLKIPLDDGPTYEMLRRGETCGVFQLESAGMRDLVKQMRVHTFEQIIAAVALYRPGPMENIPRYLACLHGTEAPDYMHPALRPILESTYGVMIYQEQVMQAAQVLAGYTGGQADLLRRAMGKKIPAEMDAQRAQFVAGAAATHGLDAGRANAIFDQIAKFAGYGFNKAHSAGYALIAYWTAYLKAHHPREFMAATMTLDAHNTDKLAVFKQELDRMGVAVLPPCVNASGAFFTVEGDAVRYALSGLKGVGEGAMEALVAERERGGPFKSLEDFVSRLDGRVLHKLQLERLICAGALDCLYSHPSERGGPGGGLDSRLGEPPPAPPPHAGGGMAQSAPPHAGGGGWRARLFAGVDGILRHYAALRDEREAGQVNLFAGGGGGGDGLAMPPLPAAEPWDAPECLKREFEAVGFYLSAHPLQDATDRLEALGVTYAAQIPPGGGRVRLAGVLIKKQEKISKKSGNKYAFLQMSDPTGVYEVTLFSELLHTARPHLVAGAALIVEAAAELREDQLRLTAQGVAPLQDAAPRGGFAPAQDAGPVVVRVARAEALGPLKDALEAAGPGRRPVVLHIPVAGGRVAAVRLPGAWAADETTLAAAAG